MIGGTESVSWEYRVRVTGRWYRVRVTGGTESLSQGYRVRVTEVTGSGSHRV